MKKIKALRGDGSIITTMVARDSEDSVSKVREYLRDRKRIEFFEAWVIGGFRIKEEEMKARTAYFLLESQTNDDGEFRVLIAVENEDGYYKTDWFWGKDLAVAEQIAQEKNEMMGITREEAFKIVASTMRKGAIEKPIF